MGDRVNTRPAAAGCWHVLMCVVAPDVGRRRLPDDETGHERVVHGSGDASFGS
jgi:hypothetical protein